MYIEAFTPDRNVQLFRYTMYGFLQIITFYAETMCYVAEDGKGLWPIGSFSHNTQQMYAFRPPKKGSYEKWTQEKRRVIHAIMQFESELTVNFRHGPPAVLPFLAIRISNIDGLGIHIQEKPGEEEIIAYVENGILVSSGRFGEKSQIDSIIARECAV